MKIFIAGATGVLGRRVVARLVAAGHQVSALSRSQANRDWLAAHGAEPRQADLFNAEQVRAAAAGAEAVLHLATAIPTGDRPSAADWARNDRIRREGTANLVEAALQVGAKLYIQQGITFIYGDRQGDWVDEQTPVGSHIGGVLQSALDMERIVADAARERQLPAVVLRFGMFYAHDSVQTRGMLDMISRGRFPVIGGGRVWWSLIHADDAAAAVAHTVEVYPVGLGQTFNIVDDEPVLYRELVHAIARKLGARRPGGVPAWLARRVVGSGTVDFLLASTRVRNQLAAEVLGWRPQYPTYREGYAQVIEAWRQANDR
jgi:2-alkyl-3-oxoalkanoate reductase